MSDKMTPAEFADMLEDSYSNTKSMYETKAECLGYDVRTTTINEDARKLFDAIRSLDAGIPYPLDKDGVPIKIGDTVYSDKGNKYEVISMFIDKNQTVVNCKNECFSSRFYHSNFELTHNASRTLEDIKDEATSLVITFDEADGMNRTEKLERLIDEAYEIGRKEGGRQ